MADDLRSQVRPERLTEFDSWRSLGLSEAGALEALRGHDPVSAVLIEGDGFDHLADRFQALGLSEAAAKTATVGRDTEAAVRAKLKAPPAPKADAEEEPVPAEDPTAADKAAAEGEPVKAPAKKAAAKKAPAKKVAAKEADLRAGVARHEARGLTFLEALAAAEAEANPKRITIDETTRSTRP